MIRPTIVGNSRCPTPTQRVLIVRITAEAFVQLSILAQLLTIELYPKPGSVGHSYLPIVVLHQTALDYVVSQVVIMRISGVGKIWDHGTEVQHGRKLDPELSGRMNGDAKLERLAHAG